MIDKKWKHPFGPPEGLSGRCYKNPSAVYCLCVPFLLLHRRGGAEPLDARPEADDRHRVHLGPALGQKGG